MSKNSKAKSINVPSHVKVTSFESPEWEKLVRSDSSYKSAKGIAMQAWSGSNDELYPTAFAGKSPANVRDMWYALCKDERMADVETKFYGKFGGFGALPFEQWSDKVMALFPENLNFTPDLRVLYQAIRQTYNELLVGVNDVFGQDTIVPLTIEESLEKIKKGANSGFPFYSKHWSDREPDGTWKNPNMVEYYVKTAQSLVNGVNLLQNQPYMLFTRVGNDGINTPKMRPIEAPSKSEALAGNSVADSFLKAMRTIPTYWGQNGSDRCAEKVHDLFKFNYTVEGDFSNFDSTAGGMMPYVFMLLKSLSPSTHHEYLDNLLKYYQSPKVLTPIGLVESTKPSGLMSGSSLTSLIGTLTNAIAVKYVMLRMGNTNYKHLSFGDDVALGCNEFNLESFIAYNFELGLVCNKEKQGISQGPNARVSFLGFYHFKEDGPTQGIFPIMRTAPKMYYRENFVDIETAATSTGVDIEEFEGLNKEGIDLLAFVSKLNNLRNNKNFPEIIAFFRENESYHMDTNKIVPFERLQMAVRCGRTSSQVGLEGSPTMVELYKLEQNSPILDLTPSSLEEVVTINGNTVVLQIIDSSLPMDDISRTKYTRVIDTNVDDLEKAMTKLSNKLEGMKVLKHFVPKKVKEAKTPGEQKPALIFERISLIAESYIVNYLPKSKKYSCKVTLVSPVNGVIVKEYEQVGDSAHQAELLVAELTYKLEEKITKSNQLYELVTLVS